MPVPLRVLAASLASVVLTAVGALAIVIGTGQGLEDACVTRLPASGRAPAEFEVVRGPIREGLVTYRGEHDERETGRR